jgi:phosphonopyruvate decarboxylase
MKSVGRPFPSNLIHIILGNDVCHSTGSQAIASGLVGFTAVALACAYQYAAA